MGKNRIRTFLLYSMSIVVVTCIVMGIVSNTAIQVADTKQETTAFFQEKVEDIMVIGNALEEEIETFKEVEETSNAQYEEYVQIEALMERYFHAVCGHDIEVLENIVESTEKIAEEKLIQKTAYVEEYTNFIYSVESGLAEDTYIVYVSYDIKCRQYDTLIPALERFYVKSNSDGAVYIYRGELDGESAAYMQQVEQFENIVLLKESRARAFEEACYEEDDLQDIAHIVLETFWIDEQ